MHEQLLQFIWRSQYFNSQDLCVETGETLQIMSQGEQNTHQGPDFLDARLRIGAISWVGNIELHVLASDWTRHAHEEDPLYNNIILHVVWENDRPGSQQIPVLVLQDRVPKLLLGKYEEWMKSSFFVACERQVQQPEKRLWSAWKRELLGQRLQRKAVYIETCLRQNGQHWEETTWWLLARNFGLSVNAGSFESIARSLPLHILARCRGQVERLEALLLGQAGLLHRDFRDEYPRALQREFRYLQNKYRLPPIHQPVLFLRMRPDNFPTIRLAQLAGLLSRVSSWFARIKEADSPMALKEIMDCTASGYWDHHYLPEERSAFRIKKLGEQMRSSLIINTCSPLLFAYGLLRGEKSFLDKAFRWLEQTRAEKNSQIAGWARLGVDSAHAADSQALLELRGQYCKARKCLTCAIGNILLGRALEGAAGD
jgi:uncharacterized protein DUF2851